MSSGKPVGSMIAAWGLAASQSLGGEKIVCISLREGKCLYSGKIPVYRYDCLSKKDFFFLPVTLSLNS